MAFTGPQPVFGPSHLGTCSRARAQANEGPVVAWHFC